MVQGVTQDSKLGRMGPLELKRAVSKAITEAGGEKYRARTAHRLSQGGLLIEMETDEGATWMRSTENAQLLCTGLGTGLSFKPWPYNVIAFNVPTTLDPDSEDSIEEISEINDIEKGHLTKMRWVKPVTRRANINQMTAHLILTFSNADDANRAILSGLAICHKRVNVEKCKREPVRCMKCQGWNHIASECPSTTDICGQCGENDHWTKNCPDKTKKYCVSCKSDDHSSYDRACPAFIKKCEDLNKRIPENNMPFFPSNEPWTWSSRPAPSNGVGPSPAPTAIPRGNNQKERRQIHKELTAAGRQLERLSWDRPEELPPINESTLPAPPTNPFSWDMADVETFTEDLPLEQGTNA